MKEMRFFPVLLVIAVAGVMAAGCLATPIEVVDAALVGDWQGECRIGLPVLFDPGEIPEGVERTYTTVSLDLTIHEDATVEGALGEAAIDGSVLKRNRSELGRALNMASDYIVTDGVLSGAIVPGEDEGDPKQFTIPFDLVDGQLEGGVMWVEPSKYPFPLCTQVALARTP